MTRQGARLGKGGGYCDLEYGLLREAGGLERDVPILTTVHSCQVLPDGMIPMTPHDISLDWIVTPEELIACERSYARPPGVLWERLDEERIEAIPVLQQRRPVPGGAGAG